MSFLIHRRHVRINDVRVKWERNDLQNYKLVSASLMGWWLNSVFIAYYASKFCISIINYISNVT